MKKSLKIITKNFNTYKNILVHPSKNIDTKNLEFFCVKYIQ